MITREVAAEYRLRARGSELGFTVLHPRADPLSLFQVAPRTKAIQARDRLSIPYGVQGPPKFFKFWLPCGVQDPPKFFKFWLALAGQRPGLH